MDLEQIRKNSRGKILEFSVSSIIAMLLTYMITIVDGFFVGNYVGKEGLAAINLGLPVLYFYLPVGLMLSVGGIAIAGMSLGAGILFAVLMLVGGNWYADIFGDNGAVNEMAKSGIKIFVISFLFSGINTICSMYFTSIGKAKESAVISASRGLVILLICVFTLPKFLGMTGVWLVSPVTEFVTILICAYYLINDKKVNSAK